MMHLILVVTTVVTGLIYYLFQKRQSQKCNLPPGPLSLPIVGNLPFVDVNNVPKTYHKWAKQYGPIFRTTLGQFTSVVLNDPALIKEAFSQEVFVSRPKMWNIDQRRMVNNNTNGIIFAEGEEWKEHRRFILQTFRDFGVGKLGMEEKIITEAHELVKVFSTFDGQPFDNRIPLGIAMANVIASVLTGTRYEASDSAFLTFMGHVKEMFSFDLPKTILGVFPWTRHFPPINKTYQQFMTTTLGLRNFLVNIFDEHLKNWAPGKNENFLDFYINAVKAGSYKSFSYDHVPLLLEDVFEAGYETTTTTLRWAFLMMCVYPEVQTKVQKELDEAIPNRTIPKPSDKYILPYVEATIQEVHRFASVVPMGVNHCASEDAKLGGYDIPKGTWLAPNLRYIHHNDEWWEKPEVFNPERFLASDGTFKEFSEYMMPFSVGKRRCLGESLAKAEIYTLFIAILQNFELHFDGDVSTVDLEPLSGVTADAKPHLIMCVPRV